jgi:hypothetical protein
MIGAIIMTIRYVNHIKPAPVGLSNQTQEDEIDHSQLTELTGSGMQLVAENSQLSLSVDFNDGNIEVLNKRNGYIWRSKPSAEEFKRERSNQLWKDNISSPIIFEYVNDPTAAKTMFGNVNSQNTKIQIFKLDDGVRVYFDFTKTGVKIAYDALLQDDHLDISIPSYLIREPGVQYIENTIGAKKVNKGKTVLLTNISLFPFLGAARSDQGEEGYLFLPDGPGALIKFDSDKGLNSQFVGAVYGSDLSYLNKYDTTLRDAMRESKILYPVFGIVRERNALMGIIDRGDTNADIIGTPAGVQTGFNTAYPRFNFRNKYKVITSPSDGNGYFRYTDSGIVLSRSVKYYFQSGESASYIGMAQDYRKYLMESKGLQKQDKQVEGTPLQLNIFGGTTKQNFVGRSFVSMTTFKQAEEILNFFKENGVEQIDVTYQGWGSKGSPVAAQSRFPAASDLGGNEGMTRFVEYSHSLGYRVFLEDDQVTAASRKGLSLGKNVITNVLGNPLDYGWNGDGQYFLNLGTMLKAKDKSMAQYEKYGIDGIEENGIGRYLNTDFNRSQPISRDDMKNHYVKMLDDERSRLNAVRLTNAMAYGLADRTTIADMPMDGSYLTVLDEAVPFYPIALHALVPYVFSDYNQFSEPAQQLLKALEYGGNVSFTVTFESPERLADVSGNRMLSTEFSVWKNTIVSQYQRISGVLDEVQGQYIVGYHKLTPDVSVVTYENGATVVCNYADKPFTYEGRTVAPMDFILIKGQG